MSSPDHEKAREIANRPPGEHTPSTARLAAAYLDHEKTLADLRDERDALRKALRRSRIEPGLCRSCGMTWATEMAERHQSGCLAAPTGGGD